MKAPRYSSKGSSIKKTNNVYEYKTLKKTDTRMKFWIKTQITRLWCRLTNADAVFIKMLFSHESNRIHPDYINYSISVKVARRRFDPFVNSTPLSVVQVNKSEKKDSDKRNEIWLLQDDGTIAGKSEVNKWTYVNLGKRVEHNLKHGS